MAADAAPCTVYFDGACPLCRREIAHYRRQAGGASVAWVDAAACAASELGGLDRDIALLRLHVRRADGSLVTGAAAFIAIWAQLPGYAWLARIAARGRLPEGMEAAYAVFLRLRRLWRPPGSPRASARAAFVERHFDGRCASRDNEPAQAQQAALRAELTQPGRSPMGLLNKLPGFQRAPAGLEWSVLRRLPLITIAGTALLLAAALGSTLVLGADPASAKLASTLQIFLASLLVLYWTAVFTVALFCLIVFIAKGPAYVADAYPLIDAERPRR